MFFVDIWILIYNDLYNKKEMWDRKTLKMACKPQAPDSTSFEWSADGEHILVATTAPRLRQGNLYKIMDYQGQILKTQEFKELWEVKWRPVNPSLFPVKPVILGGGGSSSSSSSSSGSKSGAVEGIFEYKKKKKDLY